MVCQAGAKMAANVCITLDFLGQAKTICAQEIGLIDKVIAKNNIPFPKSIPRTRPIINFTADDDMLEPDALRCIAEAYVATGADLIVGGCVRFGETRSDERWRHHTSVVIGQTVSFDALDVLRFIVSWEKANYFYQPEAFFSRRIWSAGGYIKKHLYYVMDYDLWFRMALAGASIYHIPAMIGCSRIHARQKTREEAEYLHQVRQLMEEYLDLFCALETASAAGCCGEWGSPAYVRGMPC